MKAKLKKIAIVVIACISSIISLALIDSDSDFVTYIADPKTQNIKLYWKNDKNQNLKSIKNLKFHLENKHQKLEFATNAGMYKKDNSPQGLYIENKKVFLHWILQV